MMRTIKKSMSILLALTLIFGSLAFGLSDVNFTDFAVTAKAEDETETFTEGYYTYTVDEHGNAIITDCDTSVSGAITIPPILDGHKVVSIGKNAFFMCKDVSEITIPDGVTNIAESAFSSCGIEKITIPDSVIEIGYGAFQCNLRLISAVVGNGVVSIGDFAFYMCNNLLNVSFGSGLTSIGENAFNLCGKMKNLKIPGNVKQIGNGAFSCCSSLESVIISEGVETIGYKAFGSCSKLEYVHIPSTVIEFIPADYESDVPVTILTSSPNAYICSNTGNCQARIYAEENNIKFMICDEHKTTEKPTEPGETTFIPTTTKPVVTEPSTTKPIEIPSTTKPIEIPTTTKPTTSSTTKPIETTVPTTEPTKPVEIPTTTKPVEATKPTTTKPESTTKPVVEEEIIKKPSTSTVKYGETLILHADFDNVPADVKIEWSVEGNGVTIVPSTDGKTCAVTSTATGDVTITAKYVDSNGVEHVSEQEIESNASFWQKIVSFFKNLFGISRIIEQRIKF